MAEAGLIVLGEDPTINGGVIGVSPLHFDLAP